MTASGSFQHLVDEALRLQSSDLPKSLQIAREAYELADPSDNAQLARAATLLGGLLRLRGVYDEAEELLLRGLEHEPELRVKLAAHIQLGQVYLERGMKDESLASFEAALKLLGGEDMPEKLADIHLNLGNLHSTDTPARALQHYSAALASYSRIGDETGIATVQANTGVLAQLEGHHAEAIETFAQASRMLSSLDQERLRAIVRHRTAISHYHLCQYSLALGECRAALDIANKQHIVSLRAMILSTESEIHDAMSEPALAEASREEAEAILAVLRVGAVKL
jgi:tetratricopeptide (TPR) repeat protein